MRRYEIVLEGQLGERFGTLSWTESDGAVSGSFAILGFENPVSGRREGARLELVHQLRTAVSSLSCKTWAEVRGGELTGEVATRHSRMPLRGKQIAERTKRNEISE